MKIRDAKGSDFDTVFMMGFDIWSEGSPIENYLKSCYESPKYKKGQFKVLESGDKLLSSLILYQLSESSYGIGSIATPIEFRKQGYGSKITLEIAEQLEKKKNYCILSL